MKKSPEACWNILRIHLQQIAPEYREAYLQFHDTQKQAFLEMPASVSAHHAQIGGYAIHVCEVVTNIVRLVSGLKSPELPTLSDAIIAAYIHDKDKLLMRYVRDTEPPTEPQRNHFHVKKGTIRLWEDETKTTLSMKIDAAVKGQPQPTREEVPWHRYRDDARNMDDSAAVLFLCHKHGLGGITEDICHAVSLHHGGWAPLAIANSRIRLSPLAALLHAADLMSSHVQKGEEVK